LTLHVMHAHYRYQQNVQPVVLKARGMD